MAYQSAKSAYQHNEVLSLPPQRLVVLLYTHLVSNLRLARHHLDRGEIAPRVERLTRAFDIVQELKVTLDHDAGGQIAASLDRLYGFWMAEILRATRHGDAAALGPMLDKLVAMAVEMHGAWEQAANAAAPAAPVARTA